MSLEAEAIDTRPVVDAEFVDPEVDTRPEYPFGTASGTERLLACAASVVLPQVRSSNRYTERGHGLHAFVRAVLSGVARAQAIALVTSEEDRDTAERIDFGKLGADLQNVRCEVAYAVDPVARTAREIGINVGREYSKAARATGTPLGPNERPGADDIEGVRIDGVPVILDLKFGWERVTECAENGQILTFTAAKRWATAAGRVEGRIAYIRPSGRVDLDAHEFDALAIESFGDELEDAYARVHVARRVYLAGGVPILSPGSQCRYCGALSVCPEYTALARSMATRIDELGGNLSDADLRVRVEALTQEQAGRAWVIAHQAETLLERVIEALKARAKREPIPTIPGKEARLVKFPKDVFSQKKAIDLLKTKGASEGEIASLYSTTEIEQVRECNVPGEKKAHKPRKKAA